MEPLGINVFRERAPLLEALRTGRGLPQTVVRMLRSAFACALLYGIVLGAQMGGWQIAASPVKFPLILLGTGAICCGALYVLLALAGARLSWAQVTGLALCSITASVTAMAALLPVAAFWTLFFHDDVPVITLTHTAAFSVAGWVGVRFGMEMAEGLLPERRMLRTMRAWMWLYGLVGQQMAWIFRPHFHSTTVFMRPLQSGGSALEQIWTILTAWLHPR
jgi:hypothetical protein